MFKTVKRDWNSHHPRSIDWKEDEKGCWICTSHSFVKGRPQITRKGLHGWMSHWLWEECFGDVPKGKFVCHKCNDARCINPEHLYLGTPQQNQDDRLLAGTDVRGEKNPAAKLTEKKVRTIRSLYCKGDGGELSRIYGVTYATIHNIVRRKTWRFVHSI